METLLTKEKVKGLKLGKKTSLLVGLSITIIAMIIEFIFGYLTNSVMLRSDAVHMLSHALALAIALLAILYAEKQDKEKARRIEALSAFTNALLIFGFVGWIFVDSILKFYSNDPILTDQLFWIAIFGLAVNLLTALVLVLGGIEDLNTKGAFLHMLADTFSSLAIIGGAVLTHYFNWTWLDPILSMIIGLIILKWGISLIKESVKVLLKNE